MQHDSVIWKVINPQNGGFCSFRRNIPGAPMRFCKNAYNVLGICNEMACPLANSRYATIREKKGECYLMIKTIERAHQPSKQWQKIKLSKDYMTALKQIDEYLLWWPKWRIHKCKLRLTKIHQFIIRSRKLALSVQPKLVRIWKPYERQQRNRERKARIAAKISNVVKGELLQRLHEGVYEGIYNFPQQTFQDVMKEKGEMDKEEEDEEEEEEEEKEKEKEKQMEHEFIGVVESDIEQNDDYETDDDIEETQKQFEYEYEYENEHEIPQMQMQRQQVNNNHNRNVQHRNYSNNKKWNYNKNRNNKNNKNSNSNSSILGKRKSVHWKDQKNNKKKRKIAVQFD